MRYLLLPGRARHLALYHHRNPSLRQLIWHPLNGIQTKTATKRLFRQPTFFTATGTSHSFTSTPATRTIDSDSSTVNAVKVRRNSLFALHLDVHELVKIPTASGSHWWVSLTTVHSSCQTDNRLLFHSNQIHCRILPVTDHQRTTRSTFESGIQTRAITAKPTADMAYQPFPAPLPSPPAEGHSLPFLPSKRIELIRRAGAFATPPPRRGSWVFSADSDGDSECSEDSPSARRLSMEERVMSIPTIVLSKCPPEAEMTPS